MKTIKYRIDRLQPASRLSVAFRGVEFLKASGYEKFKLPFRDSSEAYLENLSDEGRQYVEKLATIEGIAEISVSRHDLILECSRAYEWTDEDLLPGLMQAIGKVAEAQGNKVLILDD